MKLRTGWVLAILGALICCTLVANGQRHERTPVSNDGAKSSRGGHRFTTTEEDAHWDPEKTEAKPHSTQVEKHAKSTVDSQTSNRNNRKSNYRTESRQEQTPERAGVRTSPRRTSDDITKTNRDTRNNRRTESQKLIDSERTERKQPLLKPVEAAKDDQSSLNLTPALPAPTRQTQPLQRERSPAPTSSDGEVKSKRKQRNERVLETQKEEVAGQINKSSRNQRNSPRHSDTTKLVEHNLERSNENPANNRRMDTHHTYDVAATEHKETLIDQENIAHSNSNPSSILARPTRETRPSKRENISPDDNDVSKTNRGGGSARRGNSQSSDTSEPTEKRGRSYKSRGSSDIQDSADVKPSRRQQILSRNTDSSNTITASPRPTRDSPTSSRGRSHYSPEANEEAEPIKSRGRNVDRNKDTVRSSRGQSRNNGSSRKAEEESTNASRSRQYSRREPSPRTEEVTSRSKTETGSRRGSPESRRDAIRSRTAPTNDAVVESKRNSPVSKSEKLVDASRESQRSFSSSRRPSTTSSNERKAPIKEVVTKEEDSQKRRDPSRSRGGRLPGRPNKPKKSLDFEINDDDNYPQEFIQKIRQTSSEVQSPLTSSTEDVVDVEETAVTNNSPTLSSSSAEVTSTESTSVRAPSRTSAFNQRRTTGLRNTNNVTPVPETTLPSVPRATNSRLQSLLKSRARSSTVELPSTEAPRPDIRARFSRLKSPLDADNAIVPEEEISSSSVATDEAILPEPTQTSEPFVPKKPGFRPRQPFVPKPRTPEIQNAAPPPRAPVIGNIRPRPTQFALPRTSSEISRQIPPISTRLKAVTLESRKASVETSNPLFRGLQRPSFSSKLRAVNLPTPEILEEKVEDQVQVDEEEEHVSKPSFKPKIPTLRESEENQERISKFKPKAKDLTVPKYTSGFRRNLPGTTSFETRNEVRTTTQLAGVVPKHRFSSRYRSDLSKTASRSATPAYVATVPTIISTAGTSSTTTTPSSPPSTVEYVFQDTGPRPRKRSRGEMMHSQWANQY